MADTTSSDAPAPPADAGWIQELRAALEHFFHRTRDDRGMPWRATGDPYAIWVSEIMLQQTRVETAIPYYNAWMGRFPTVAALAEAEPQDVLKQWEGLGYYSRARNLHRAAQVVRERYGGVVPDRLEALRALPGIGSYTAGAVGSIAFGLRAPAVDGNVRRVASRLLDWPDPRGKALETTVGAWVPEEEPGDFNQALMELGATVCLPRGPRCGACPLAKLCRARGAGSVDERPERKVRAPVPKEVHAVTVAVRGGGEAPTCLALRRRPETGLLAGMWEFPAEVVDASREPGSSPGPGRPLPAVRHAFTHLHVTYRPVLVRYPLDAEPPDGCVWVELNATGGLPLPVAQQSIVGSAAAALRQLDLTD